MDCDMMKKLFSRWADIMIHNKDYLTDLDSVAGDGDLGIVLCDGFTAVVEAVAASEETDLGKLCYLAGKTLSRTAPSSMGTLIASGLMNAGKRLRGKTVLDASGIACMLESIAEGVIDVGGAKEGEKTFLDAFLPAIRAMRESGATELKALTSAAAAAAEKGFQNATSMIARHGRIAFRGENSKGIADPGAAAAMLMIRGLEDVYNKL